LIPEKLQLSSEQFSQFCQIALGLLHLLFCIVTIFFFLLQFFLESCRERWFSLIRRDRVQLGNDTLRLSQLCLPFYVFLLQISDALSHLSYHFFMLRLHVFDRQSSLI